MDLEPGVITEVPAEDYAQWKEDNDEQMIKAFQKHNDWVKAEAHAAANGGVTNALVVHATYGNRRGEGHMRDSDGAGADGNGDNARQTTDHMDDGRSQPHLGTLMDHFQAMREETKRLKADMEALQKGYTDLQKEHRGLQQGHADLQKEHTALQKEHKRIRDDYDGLMWEPKEGQADLQEWKLWGLHMIAGGKKDVVEEVKELREVVENFSKQGLRILRSKGKK